MLRKKTGTANDRAHRNRERHSRTSFMRVRDWSWVAFWFEGSEARIASKPMSDICSTISRGVICERSKWTVHVSVARETATDVMPGTAPSPDSTVDVQLPQVMPNIRSWTTSERDGGMRVASKPISEISCSEG